MHSSPIASRCVLARTVTRDLNGYLAHYGVWRVIIQHSSQFDQRGGRARSNVRAPALEASENWTDSSSGNCDSILVQSRVMIISGGLTGLDNASKKEYYG
jgi:hypothetical protein